MIVERAAGADTRFVWVIDGHRIHERFLSNAVEAGHCWVARIDSVTAGFAVLDQNFFEQGFVAALAVHPNHRRHGLATALVRHLESVCPTEKLFTSTNQSNIVAQRLFESLAFVRSGWIDNLDEGDPEIVYFKRLR